MTSINIVNDHNIDLAIVDFFGLNSVMDIDFVEDQGYRYNVVLEDGTRRIVTRAGLDENKAEAQFSENAVYRVVSRFNKSANVCLIEMRDLDTSNLRKVVASRVSTIITKGTLVTYKNYNISVAN